MDITKFAILKKLAGGGGGGGDHADEDAIVSGTITDYTNDRVTSIRANAFRECTSLTSADFPAVTDIKNYAFQDCTSLTSADFTAITYIGVSAFFGCSLASLILRSTTRVCTLSSKYSFSGTPIDSGTGYIYVPAALIDRYKTATNWTTYANQFRALESYTVDGTTTGELDPTKVNA